MSPCHFIITGREHSERYLRTSTKSVWSEKMRELRIFVYIIITPILMCGCSHFNEGYQAKSTFEEANNLFNQGSYQASLDTYGQIIQKYPTTADRVLFEMGI